MPKDYNATLCLPKTDFPMRAALPKREPDMLAQWDEIDLYHKMVERNEGKPHFVLHDGPPFSNGYIHMGTVLNKSLKDFINRYKSMSGYQMYYVPGWDNHGMPIESAIIKQNKLDRKNMSIPEFRDACRAFAESFVDIQRGQFLRLGVLGEWQKPYLTMDKGFEAVEVAVFGKMYEKGYIYKGKRPVYWCPHDETALAEAEIEYDEQRVETLYVKFKLTDDAGKLARYCDTDKLYFVIWTTTTWTLPGNLAICLGPDIDYVIARAPSGESYILAKELVQAVSENTGIEGFEILAELKGSEFEFMRAAHPLFDRDSLVIVGDHVTTESGTGCVHTAPGHGDEDFRICRHYDSERGTDIGVIVPVDDRGHMTSEAGRYEGMFYQKANKEIAADLRENGALLAAVTIDHQYAHCWRCKNPILYRATDQWFCSVEAFRDEAIAAVDSVRWLPEWGRDRMTSMISERADWCISRQRHWGMPIPVLYCSDCSEPICTPETIAKIAEIFGEQGSNAWFTMEASELLPTGTKCAHCGGENFFKLNDTLDCWFDSGSTHMASLHRDAPEDWPASLYLEGADQYRGWFQSSMLTSVATTGKAPYEMVLTHGWTVDGEGKAMHKSLGNGIYPEDIIPLYGADVLRLWAANSDYHADVRCSDSIFKQLSDVYLKIRNTARFILGNLHGFDPDDAVQYSDMLPLDQWALGQFEILRERVIGGYENYEFHTAVHAIHNFCVVEMSNLYLDIIKDRLYCDSANGLSRRSAQTAIYLILDGIVRLIAPVLAFTSNEIWQAMPHKSSDNALHVMLNDMPAEHPEWRLSEEIARHWEQVLNLRELVNKALEIARTKKIIGKPLDAKVTICAEEGSAETLQGLDLAELAALFIVSELSMSDSAQSGEGFTDDSFPGVTVFVEASGFEKCVRCWTHSATVGQSSEHPELCERCETAIDAIETQ